MSEPVTLVAHDPRFAEMARKEAHRWQDACGAAMVAFHHIGSAAVPGLIAKPVLDIMPIFASLQKLDALKDRISALGVEWWGEHGLPGRRYCKRSDSAPVQHFHCYAAGHDDIPRHLAFRDYLRAKPSIAEAYGRIKLACAARHPDDRRGYGNCKSDWISAQEAEALIWYRQRVPE